MTFVHKMIETCTFLLKFIILSFLLRFVFLLIFLIRSPIIFYQVSSVLYEPPNPSKGFSFFNFKPLEEGEDLNSQEQQQQEQQQQLQQQQQQQLQQQQQQQLQQQFSLDKNPFKRENQIQIGDQVSNLTTSFLAIIPNS